MKPRRGEVWLADLEPVRGHEQGGIRPVLVVSVDEFNLGPGRLIYAIPLTTRDRQLPAHIAIQPPEGGLRQTSYARTDAMRSISQERLRQRWGALSRQTMAPIEDWLRTLLGL